MSAETKNLKAVNPKLNIYYIILAIITAIVLVFSFVSYYSFPSFACAGYDLTDAEAIAGTLDTERNVYTDSVVLENRTIYTKGLKEITTQLDNIAGITKVTASKASTTVDKTNSSQKITANLGTTKATYVVQDFAQSNIDYTIDAQTIRSMRNSIDNVATEDVIVASRQVKNIIVDIPGTGNGDAILFMTHYDSAIDSNGAMSAASTAAMISVIKNIVSGSETYKNDLVFVFTEGRYEYSVGAHAFYNQFVGFNNLTSRVKVGFNFDALTAGGALTIVEAAKNYGSVYAAAQNATFAKSNYEIGVMLSERNSSDFSIFYDYSNEEYKIPAVNFMMAGGTYDAGSKYDTANYADINSAVSQYAGAMVALKNAFGNATLDYSANLDGSGISLFGLNIGVGGILLLVLAIISLLLLVGYVVFGYIKKDIDLIGLFKGAATVLATGIITTGVLYGAYFLIALLASAVGGITLAQVFTNIVLTPLVFVPALLLGIGVSCGCYTLGKRLLHVKSKDCVKGVSLLFVAIGFVMTFAYPRFALPFIAIGILLTIVNFVTMIIKHSNASKGISYPLGKLFLGYVASLLCISGLIKFALIITNTFGSIFLPLMILPIIVLLSTITPYFTKLAPIMEDVFDKLPKHTIRVEKEITTTVEDSVKKGRFSEVTEVKVVNEKVAWKYRNWVGVTIISTIAVVALIICSIIGSYINPVGKNTTFDISFIDSGLEKSMYDDTVVFYKDATSTGSYKLKIKDSQLYAKLRFLETYDYWEWTYDEENKEYVRTISASNPISSGNSISGNATEGNFNVSPFYGTSSQVVLNIKNLSAGSVITIKKEGDVDFKYTCANPAKPVTLTLPYGYGICDINIVSADSVSIAAYEYTTNINAINNDAKEKMEEMKAFFDEKLGEDAVKFAFVIASNT